jgi:myo-inositol-1-phosphate synthase
VKRLGVVIIGLNGAVASTVVAGVALMKKGLAPRHGMVTEGPMTKLLQLAPLEDLVFAGWDLREDTVYEAACHHQVVQRHLLDQVKDEISFKAWPAVVSEKYLSSMSGKNVVGAKSFRDELKIVRANIEAFKAEHNLSRVVMLNLASTERHLELAPVHRTVEAFEAGLDASDDKITPAMKYLYLAIEMGIAHANFTPSLSKIPALETLSEKKGVPIAGEDGKTGQTLLKTVLAPMFVVRKLHIEGWYSTNILGNNDGAVLNDPGSNKTKVLSKKSVLDDILGYKVEDHQVHIHYYKPRGDAKEAWDNIDMVGFLGERMQLKVNFLCKDSILAAPVALDMVRLLDVAKKYGEKGIQRQLSLFFKAPYHTEGEQPVHDLFKQDAMLQAWTQKIGAKVAAETQSGANGHAPSTSAGKGGGLAATK